MCGIAGIFRRRGGEAADAGRIERMTELLVHRGPDDFGYLALDSHTGAYRLGQRCASPTDGPGRDLHLGSRRLAILDLTDHGRQPMSSRAGDLWLVFNGEIYNYLELRDTLRQFGHTFRTDTDTEVILHAYQQWGLDCVTRFNGMWAFALWDQRRRRLFCSRDRFSIKPFYYTLTDEAFIFASEIKAILPALPQRPRPNDAVIHDFLVSRTVCSTPDTFFAGIHRLPSASNLCVTADAVRQWTYWNYDTVSHEYDTARPAQTLRQLLDDAVGLRLRSDVPAGVALSGGVDSTSVLAAMAAQRPGERFHAFAAVFPGFRLDESRYAHAAAEHYGAQLHTVEYRGERLVDDLAEVIWYMDYPTLDYQTLPRRALMREAKRYVTVVLEGQGSDEMLAGYDFRYFLPHALDLLAIDRSPGEAWRLCAAVWRAYGWWPLLHGVARQLGPLEALRLRSKSLKRGLSPPFVAAHGGPRPLRRPQVADRRLTCALRDDHGCVYLPMLLKFGDATCMAASVEGRVPFLDYRLVEFVFQLAHEHKMRPGLTKCVLREAMADRLPPMILDRRDKIGFHSPAVDWIAAHLDEQIRPVLTSRRFRERGYFEPRVIEKLLHIDRLKDFYASDAIFQALSVELWCQRFIDDPPPRW